MTLQINLIYLHVFISVSVHVPFHHLSPALGLALS